MGIRAGQTLAEARATAPELVCFDDDPLGDRQRLEALAVWAQCLSPVVHIEGEDTLLVDVGGCERLFDGEKNLLRKAWEGVESSRFTVRGAIADTPGAAWALAHAHPDGAVIAEPGRSLAELAALPTWSLRIDPPAVAALASVGVRTIASLLHLPRSSLVSRFGQGVLDRIDQALGDLPEVLTPYRPQAALTSSLDWGAPIGDWQILAEAVRRATEDFCAQLGRRVAGVRQVFVTFACPQEVPEGGTWTRAITLDLCLSRPTRSARRLHELLRVRLEELRLPAPAESLTVWASRCEPLDDPQQEFFNTEATDGRALGDLLDRLALRLGAAGVVRAESVGDYQPERAFRYVSVVGSDAATSPAQNGARRRGAPPTARRVARGDALGTTLPPRSRRRGGATLAGSQGDSATGPRPVRLRMQPVPIVAMSVVPDGPPIAFRFHGVQHTVVQSVGPERIETGWWRGPHVRRDYYRTTTDDGRKSWLFRDRKTGQWFLHGWFD